MYFLLSQVLVHRELSKIHVFINLPCSGKLLFLTEKCFALFFFSLSLKLPAPNLDLPETGLWQYLTKNHIIPSQVQNKRLST